MKDQEALTRANFCQFLALFLACMGLFWGFCCLLFLFHWPGALIFAPGYAITAGYIARAFGVTSRPVRKLIWAASMLVQGVWLGWAIGQLPDIRHTAELLFLFWWLFAFVASVIAFLAEPKSLAPEPWWAR